MQRRAPLVPLLAVVVAAAAAPAAQAQAGCNPADPGSYWFSDRLVRYSAKLANLCDEGEVAAESVVAEPLPPSGQFPSSCDGATRICWTPEAGDEGEYVLTEERSCTDGTSDTRETHVTLVRHVRADLEVDQAVSEGPYVPTKRTIVRAHLGNTSGAPGEFLGLSMRLRAFDLAGSGCDLELPGSPLDTIGGASFATTDFNLERDLWNPGNAFELPEAWLSGVYRLVLEGAEGEPLFACTANSTRPGRCTLNLGFSTPPPNLPDGTPGDWITLRLLAIPWRTAGGALHVPTLADLENVAQRVEATLPTPRVNWSLVRLPEDPALTLPAAPTKAEVRTLVRNALVRASRYWVDTYARGGFDPSEGPVPLIHGVLADPPGGASGLAAIGQGVSVGFESATRPSTHAHEITHALGMPHSVNSLFDPTPPDPLALYGACGAPALRELFLEEFPNFHLVDGRQRPTLGPAPPDLALEQAVYGLDVWNEGRGEPAVKPDTRFFDLMGWCAPRWISQFTWQRLQARIETWDDDLPGCGPTTRTLRIYMGTVSESGALLRDVFEIPACTATFESELGDFELVLIDEGENEIDTITFDPIEISREEPGDPLEGQFIIPLIPNPAVARAEIRYLGLPMGGWGASANAPTVQVLAPNGGESLPAGEVELQWAASDLDGDPLTYRVEYSPDDGDSWVPIESSWGATTLTADLGDLPPSTEARWRVTASDGYREASDESDGTFTVADGPPVVRMLSPTAGETLAGRQFVVFTAVARDGGTGRLPDGALSWTSSVDGALGTGERLDLFVDDLTPGTHTISVSAEDGARQSATVQTTLHVADVYPPGMTDLAAALALDRSAPRVGETVVVRATARNLGGEVAGAARTTVTWPATLGFVGAATTAGSCGAGGGGSVVCDHGDLGSRERADVDVTLLVLAEGTAAVGAAVDHGAPDRKPANDTASLVAELRAADAVDADADGVTVAAGDCDDADPDVYPGAPEACNGIDDDCDVAVDEGDDALCADTVACSAATCDGAGGCAVSIVDNDADGFVDATCGGGDCDDGDGGVWSAPSTVVDLRLAGAVPGQLSWTDQSAAAGPSTEYAVLRGALVPGGAGAIAGAACLGTVAAPAFDDPAPDPAPGTGVFWLVRPVNGCGAASLGDPARDSEAPSCP